MLRLSRHTGPRKMAGGHLAAGAVLTALAVGMARGADEPGPVGSSSAPAATSPQQTVAQPTKLELFLARPRRVIVRDVVDIGTIHIGRDSADPAWVQFQYVLAYEPQKPAERVMGLALVLGNTRETATFLFDASQLPEVQDAFDKANAAAAAIKVPPPDIRRVAVIVLPNGLEFGVAPGGGNGGHLGRAGPDQLGVHLSADDFVQFHDLLARTRAAITREMQRQNDRHEEP